VTTVLLVGAGAVGGRAGRQLLDTPGIDRVLVTDRSRERAEHLAATLGERAEAVPPADAVPSEVDAVATALAGDATLPTARAAVAAG
jgi:glutamyl-tRNA reductase